MEMKKLSSQGVDKEIGGHFWGGDKGGGLEPFQVSGFERRGKQRAIP